MKKKYEFSPESYFQIQVEQLVPSRRGDFPLFLYLQKNNHLMLRYNASSDVTAEDLDSIRTKGIQSFWCPNEFQKAWLDYLKADEMRAADQARSDEAADAIEILEADELTDDQKKELLSGISRELLGALTEIKDGDAEEARRAVKKCHEFADDIIRVASQSHQLGTLYEDIQLINDLPVEHSGAVSTFAVMFALGIGYSDKALLTELSIGGLLHDIGHLDIDPSALKVPERLRQLEQKLEYETHVQRGFELLQEREIELTPNVREIIEQHHERYDGQGYPYKAQGFDLNELSQIVAISDWFDRLMNGTEDGTVRSPADAIDVLCQGPGQGTPYNPELFATIVQLLEDAKNMRSAHSIAKTQTNDSLKLISGAMN